MDKGKIKTIVKGVTLLLIILAGIYLAVKYTPFIMQIASNPKDFRTMLTSYGIMGVLIFVAVQIIQVIIAFLPGEVTQIAGGYVYGTTLGTVYSMAGIGLGSVIVFFISRLLGHSLLSVVMSKELLGKFSFLMNSPKSELAMFIIFLIPGMPKDFLSYLAGITPIKPGNFFMISLIARFPALLVSSYIGENLHQGNLGAVIAVAAIACILMALGYFMKDKIIAFLRRSTQTES